jgi:hypothetical protein
MLTQRFPGLNPLITATGATNHPFKHLLQLTGLGMTSWQVVGQFPSTSVLARFAMAMESWVAVLDGVGLSSKHSKVGMVPGSQVY